MHLMSDVGVEHVCSVKETVPGGIQGYACLRCDDTKTCEAAEIGILALGGRKCSSL